MAAQARTVLLVGAGKMGCALLERWLERRVIKGAELAVVEPAPSQVLRELVAAHGVALETDIGSLEPSAIEAVILAVKPQAMAKVLPGLKALARAETVFLSIAAGTTTASIAGHLGRDARVARAMPNLPAVIGRGVSGLFLPAALTAAQRERCVKLLEAVGEVVPIGEERLLDPVTAVSGSGPAYVFLLIECLAAAAADVGLPKDVAMTLARATVTGAGELAFQSAKTASQLRQDVTSPGGTTEAALDILMRPEGLSALMHAALRAAVERARQLST